MCPGALYLCLATWLRWLRVSMDDAVAEDKLAGRVCMRILPGKVCLAPTGTGSPVSRRERARHLLLLGHVQRPADGSLAWMASGPGPVSTATQQHDCTVWLAIAVSIRMTMRTSSKPGSATRT